MVRIPEVSDPVWAVETAAQAEGQVPAVTGLESPSLFGAAAVNATAYEVKFLLTEGQAAEVAGRVGGKLAPDPHADPALGGAYLTTSVYTDTPAFDVFRRTPGYDRDKFRVRRYGSSGPVFVERKTRGGDKVRKCRARIDPARVAGLAAPALDCEWAGGWFHREVLDKRLRPVCRIAYERVAYTGTADGGTVRLTLDRNVRGVSASGWAVDPVGRGVPLLADRVVCEFKFRTAMPALFRALIADLALTPTPVSKYRTFAHVAGLVPRTQPDERKAQEDNKP